MNPAAPPVDFVFTSPHAAMQAMLSRLQPVDEEQVELHRSPNRVLSQPILADRDSPPSDVSAMDGYAVRAAHLQTQGKLDIVGEIAIGQPPPKMPTQGCLKIGTGACVPQACDGIIPREQVVEMPFAITIPADFTFKQGQHIRRQGENMRTGTVVVPGGTPITPPVASALAAFGYAAVPVYRPIHVAILTTGDELQAIDTTPQPWQIRDSNSSTLIAGLSTQAWIEIVTANHIKDDLVAMKQAIQTAATDADLIITTGGVSMGQHDYLKPALRAAGGQVVYHKLPIRPGKPTLGGLINTSNRSVPIIALPGNPVAVAVGLSLFVSPVARHLAGMPQTRRNKPQARLTNPPTRTLAFWQYLPARWVGDGVVEILSTKGSGDLAGAALAEGYVQIPPGAHGPGPWVFYDATL